MKKILLLIPFALALSQSAWSQGKKSIDGFMDIPFGSDSATVKRAFASRGAIQLDSLQHKDMLAYTGLTLSDRKVFACVIKFLDNKAFEADFLFADFAEKDVLNYFDSLASDISAVYGKGQFYSNFSDREDNTMRIRRLRSGNETGKWVWVSKNKNAIALQFQTDDNVLHIELFYQDDALLNISIAKRRSDF